MAEKSGGEQTPHWQCVECGFEFLGAMRVMKFCPNCGAKQEKKPHYGIDKHTPAPPEAKVTVPEASTDTSDEGNRKLLDAEGRQFPEPRILEKETAPPHGQSTTAAATSVTQSGTVADPSSTPPGSGQPGHIPPAKPIQATEPPSTSPKQSPLDSGSIEHHPSPQAARRDKPPSPRSSLSSAEKDGKPPAPPPQTDSDKHSPPTGQRMGGVREPRAAGHELATVSGGASTEEKGQKEGMSETALVTGRSSPGDKLFDASSSFHKGDGGSNDSDSRVPKLSYENVFGNGQNGKLTKESKGGASNTSLQHQQRVEERKKQQQMEEELKQQREEEKKRQLEEERKKQQQMDEELKQQREEEKKRQLEEECKKQQRKNEEMKKEEELKRRQKQKENQTSQPIVHPLGSDGQGANGRKRGNGDGRDGGSGGGGGGGGDSSSTIQANKGLETEFTDTPQSKKRKWQRKHSRPDSDADRRQLNPSLKRLKAYSSIDENESFIAEADNSSGEELEGMTPYKKPEEAESLLEPSRGKTGKGAAGRDQSAQKPKNENEKPGKAPAAERQPSQEYDYRTHPGPNNDLIGLKSAPEKSIAVTFHCIVPKLLWEWDKKSCIHMRFERVALGEWKHNLGDFMEVRELEDDLSEMICTLIIDADILKSPLAYKYVIFSPKMTKEHECFEFLHSFAGRYEDPNRCLWISEIDYPKAYGEEYHQYDFLVYPKITKVAKGFFDQVKETGRGIMAFFGRGSSKKPAEDAKEVDFQILSTEAMAKQCLQFYLEPCKNLLLEDGEFPAGFNLDHLVNGVAGIYLQHQKPYVKHWDRRPVLVSVAAIQSEMKNWLEAIVAELKNIKNGLRQFITSTCIACIITECKIHYNLKIVDFVVPLLRMLQPDVKSGVCTDVYYLRDVASRNFWPNIAFGVARLFKEAMTAGIREPVWDWLYVLPLYHFMNGESDPFMSLEYDPEKIKFNARAADLDLRNVKFKVPLGFVDQFYSSLEPLFTADPLLLYDFIYICRVDDYPSLFGKIPAYLSLTRLSDLAVLDLRYFYSEEATKWLKWMECISKKITEESAKESANKFQLCVATMNAALRLFLSVFGKLTRTTDYVIDVLKASIALLLFALEKVNPFVTQNRLEKRKITDIFKKCEQALREWVAKPEVIGASFFGGSLYRQKLLKGPQELEMWQSILSLKIPEEKDITDRWSECVNAVIWRRVKAVPAPQMLDLVCLLEELKADAHPILSSALMEGGMQAIDKISSESSTYGTNLDSLASVKSRRVGILFGRLLLRKYPQIEHKELIDISLDDLLNWSYWPNFIKIYKGSSKLKEGLPEKCQMACYCAISQLEEVSRQLQEGNVTIFDLQKIKDGRDQMRRLCEAASADQKKDKSDQRAGEMSYNAMFQAVRLRIEEFTSFEEQQRYLLNLCQRINPQIKSVCEAKVELRADYKPSKINTLCIRRESIIQVICFQTANCLLSFAWKFHTMTNVYNSGIFDATWSTTMKNACRSNPNMSITDVEAQVWVPAFKHCQNLLDQLASQSMTLADVDRHFQHYSGDELVRELKCLFDGVNQCLSQKHEDKWIRHTVIRIEDYRKLRGYCEAANSFLKLKQSLKLTKGDFTAVERISREVSSSMKDQTLANITEELVGTGKFLSEFTGDKLECVRKFSECQKIVEWIKATTKDVSDLQNFVNVALATAVGGEGDFANDKLSNLRTVGTGFGSLIYNLKETTGFWELSQRCNSVWTALRDNKRLPKMLDDCNKALEWYKSVKETQGSVEVTSFGQMDNILHYGCYTIAGKRDQTMHSIHDVVRLTLRPPIGKKLLRTSYSLDELRDLESKLVLITGSKAENRREVERFLDTLHCVCRIAEVLIALQQVGNVKYIGWSLQFRCQNHLVEGLQQQAKEMEDELERWNGEVTEARNEFYELNYYTTRQLLVLRSELGKVKTSGPVAPLYRQAQVMALLQSISSEVTPGDVETVVQHVAIQFSEDRKTRDRPKSPPPQKRQTASVDVEPSFAGSFPPATPSPPLLTPQEITLPSVAELDIHGAKVVARRSLPTVSLTHKDLTENQRVHFTNLREKFDYPDLFALKVLEEVGNGDWNEITNWVADNEERYADMLQEESEDEDGDEVETDEDGENESSASGDTPPERAQGVEGMQQESVSGVAPSLSPHISPSSATRVVVTHRQPIDETNHDVKKLVEAGIGSTEECIRAIEAFGTAQIALDHMMEMEEGFFQEAPVPMQHEMEIPVHSQMTGPVHTQPVTMGTGEIVIAMEPNVENKYLMLEELGGVLRQLSIDFPATVQRQRRFPERILKTGEPHLLVVPPELVLKAALSLYMEDKDLPMPTPEEMLICNQHTTAEEVNLLWQRAVCDEPGFHRTFCLVHAEKLSYQIADKALRSLNEIIQAKTGGYRLVVICSNHEEEKSHIISKLHLYRRPYGVPADIAKYQHYLKCHFVDEDQPLYPQHQTRGSLSSVAASMVDPEGSCVRIVSSTRAGMGKTLFVNRMADKLRQLKMQGTVLVTIPIHGPQVTTDSVMQYLVNHQDSSYCTILHFDISPSVLWQVDTILFSLLVQRGLCDSQGHVWRSHSSQLYAVEVTQPERQPAEKQSTAERFTVAVLDMLPSVNCVKPKAALPLMARSVPGGYVVMDEQEFKSEAYQRVYQYLRRHVMNQNLDRFSFIGNTEGTPDNCLQIVLNYCGVKDPSWAEIRHFVKFLDLQLQSCEQSIFCNEDFVGDVMAGLKSFVVKFMIRMSRDFATSSLRGEVAQENEEIFLDQNGDDDLEQYQIVERKQWEQNSHPYIFFNQDRVSITFVGFMVTSNGDLIDPAHRGLLERAILTQQLYTGLKHQGVNFDDDYRNWAKGVMIQKMSTVMGIEWPYDPDETYVLTVDNLIKILAIQMRFRCGIPVVIMGETGCGKTRLIKFMCDLAAQGTGKGNMLIMKVHGGITEKDIKRFLDNAEEKAKQNRARSLDTVVFFDEANTTEAIGLIKEIMCDRRLHGKSISDDLKFIAACNPYRRHSKSMIEKLRSAGLGFYVRETETQQKLGKIPLRELVYRVIDLPPSMRPLVYDFGQLNTDTERDYTRQIVQDRVKKHPLLSQQHAAVIPAVAQVLAWSQKYMRERKDECSFVSLRDVERAMLVFTYFFEKMDLFRNKMDKRERKEKAAEDAEDRILAKTARAAAPVARPPVAPSLGGVRLPGIASPHGFVPPPTGAVRLLPPTPAPRDTTAVNTARDLTRSLVLAVSVCYHARLSDRNDYEDGIAKQFTQPLALPGGVVQFRNEIRWCQEVLLESMVLGENIARNAALRENVFMMAVCIDLRIPLFLVGKPGSSKSLAKAIVADSMQGQASQNDLLKSFRQVHMFSYQCSQLSTPVSVIEVFNTAKRFQKNQDTSKYVSVVVLDEVGLAEDSPNLPLKALHPLLEDGSEGADDSEEVVERNKRVAFIGISNWALDPAKMNRGVMVTRGDPDTKELVVSAQGICHSESDAVRQRLSSYFDPLAEAYYFVCQNQKRQFFGLRDFYSLIKMLYWMCEKTNMPPFGPQLVHAIKRNFGGLEDKNIDPVEEFLKRLPSGLDRTPDLRNINPELHPFVNPDTSRRGLIKTSLKTKETTWHGENRYLLFLTENYAALEILKQVLQDQDGQLSVLADRGSDHPEEEQTLKPWEMEPFVLFGSSFPKDKEYTQVCRNINQIKICMETGRTVILLNLENLYESLYDVLNQYYIHHGGNRYVDLGLQTHKVKCRVHQEFKLILIAEKTTVYEKFPTPLINRLEKHFVLYSSVLEEWQLKTLSQLEDWVKAFSHVSSSDSRFKEKDAFVGYQKDTAAAVVFQASSQLRQIRQRMWGPRGEGERWGEATRRQLWETAWEADLLGKCSLGELADKEEDSEQWMQAVMLVSQYLLLQTTPPAALVRLNKSSLIDQCDRLNQLYQSQHHASIDDFLCHHMEHDTSRGGLLLQVTTHSHLLSSDEVEGLGKDLPLAPRAVHSFLLQEFDTELDFSSKVSPLFVRGDNDRDACLLIIQCDSGHINGDLIACARYRIYDMRAKALLNKDGESRRSSLTHVLFIVHLPVQAVQSSFVGFQGDPWVSCHIDELRASDEGALTLERAQGASISELFYGGPGGRRRGNIEPELERQVSDFTSSLEGMVFQRVRSVEEGGEDGEEEMEEGGERRRGEDMEVMDIEDKEEEEEEEEEVVVSRSDSREAEEEMEHGEGQGDEEDDVIEREGPTRTSGSASAMHEGEETSAMHEGEEVEESLSEEEKSMYKQCVRLNSCIQAAASRLQDSTQNKKRATERVELLINLVPLSPQFPLDPGSFYSILVSHIHRILRERESVFQDTNWVLNEAMNSRNLQTGGTFKNVLARKLDDVIVPIFSEIIAFFDHNCNLSLFQAKTPDTPLAQFWLQIFGSERAMQALCYEDMVGRQKVPMREEEFACQFPFSWLVRELVEAQWDIAKNTGGSSTQRLHQQLCVLVEDKPLGEILASVPEGAQCEEMYRRYLYDFVRSVHKCTHKQKETVDHEYKLISDTLHKKIVRGRDFVSMDGHVKLTNRIAAVHVVYRAVCECVHWFGQLTLHNPGILAGLVERAAQQVAPEDDEEMILHLYAVNKVLDGLKPPIEADRESQYSEDTTLRQWLIRLQRFSNAIESTLSLPGNHPLAIRARQRWQVIRAIQMFTEHVLLNHGNMVRYVRRLQITMGEEADFLQCTMVQKLKRVLNHMHTSLKKEYKSKEQKKQLEAIRKSCRNFFIEVVSGLCFGQSHAPEDELVEMLLNIVFTERGEGEGGGEGAQTRDFSPYTDDMKKSDKSPVIRSFLLQLLLEHNTEKVKGHLRSYFDWSQRALVVDEGVDQELCLLCTRCFEDALDKEHSGLGLEEQMRAATELLTSGLDTLARFSGFTEHDISLELLEGVAKMRYALLVVAQLLQLQVNEVGRAPSLPSRTHNLYGSVASILLDEARRACTAEGVNTIDATGKRNTTGPIVYLLKLLVRQAGVSCLKKAADKHQWVVPRELCRAEEEKTLDPFVIHNPTYSPLREGMTTAAYGRDYKALEDSSAALQPQECVPLLLSVYQVVTMSRASTLPSRQLLPEVLEKLNEVIINCKALPKELQVMARALVSNEQGGPLAALRVSPGQPGAHRTLGGVVIHTAASLLSRRRVELLHPLVTMLCKPGDMANAYLPTMPEDMLPEARRIVTGGQFYECPNGHPYFVGECGRPVVQAVCNMCGSAIGGQNHRAVGGNRAARSTDTTQTGHSLGRPTAREAVPSPERALSPAACCILRAIMHSALLWASCSSNTATEGLLALVKVGGGIRPPELPEFFWGHLERDLHLLGRALGKNAEEAAIVVHLVLRNILTSDPIHSTVTSILKTLGARNAREEWEKQFSLNYMQPVLEKLEDKLGRAMGAILGDDKQDHDPLFYLVYERMPVVQGSLEPHLWGYRPRIALDHLTQYMQQRKGKFPILKEFLKEEPVLRATQYLPDIVRLQRRMFDKFHYRIDRRVARDRTMRQFIDSRPSENVRNEYRQMVSSVQSAWALVRDKLRDHGQLRVKDEYLKPVLDLDSTLEYFIPTTTGPGACTFALVHYLVYVHNNFIDWCRGKNKASTWQEHKVQLPHIHACHLLDYQSQLQSILLSHCHYSLHVGHGHEVSYDVPALEKHILDRFIHGKPRILVDIPQVNYQKDVYTAATFSAVRKKVAKQVSLPSRVQTEILLELRSPDMLRRSLDVVDIVLGFLTSGGGKPKTRLVSYLRKLKMEKKTFSEKAKEHCNLEHILSLWQTLSVGLARVITLSDQEPFDTLNSELLEELTETQYHQLDQALPKFDLGTLLSILYEFIETYIRHIDVSKKEWGMTDVLAVHLETNELEVPKELLEFPEDITLAQTVAAWKYVVHFQARQRQR